MKLSRAALRPLLAAHERGALPLVGVAWGVIARKSSHNASNARGVAAGKMGHNSSNINLSKVLNLFNNYQTVNMLLCMHNQPIKIKRVLVDSAIIKIFNPNFD